MEEEAILVDEAGVLDPRENMKIYLQRYPEHHQSLVLECIDKLKLTRRSGKMADSVILAELKRWDSLDASRVIAGITTYLDKEFYLSGKNERYLWGIMRRMSQREALGIDESSRKEERPYPYANVL